MQQRIKIDKEGYFYLVDRIKDMVNVSGNKVYTKLLDDFLYGHSAIEHAAAIGVPDVKSGERVKLYIQLKPEYVGKIKEEDIKTFLIGKFPQYYLPKYVEFIDDMPLTEIQKVKKNFLRERELEKHKK